MYSDETKKAVAFLKREMIKNPFPRILVVEDDPNDLELLLRVLKLFKVEVIVATWAQEARKLMDKDGISLVFLDLKLPIVPGLELLKERKNLNPDTHWVVVSGAHDVNELNEALKEGAVLVLEKPVTFETLADILEPRSA